MSRRENMDSKEIKQLLEGVKNNEIEIEEAMAKIEILEAKVATLEGS